MAVHRAMNCCAVWAAVLTLVVAAAAQNAHVPVTPFQRGPCNGGAFFDTALLECTPCPQVGARGGVVNTCARASHSQSSLSFHPKMPWPCECGSLQKYVHACEMLLLGGGTGKEGGGSYCMKRIVVAARSQVKNLQPQSTRAWLSAHLYVRLCASVCLPVFARASAFVNVTFCIPLLQLQGTVPSADQRSCVGCDSSSGSLFLFRNGFALTQEWNPASRIGGSCSCVNSSSNSSSIVALVERNGAVLEVCAHVLVCNAQTCCKNASVHMS